jgi:hypothetical protein
MILSKPGSAAESNNLLGTFSMFQLYVKHTFLRYITGSKGTLVESCWQSRRKRQSSELTATAKISVKRKR